jgi:hypothetical protein
VELVAAEPARARPPQGQLRGAPRAGRRLKRFLIYGAALLPALLFLVSELVLPGVAERNLREDLVRKGKVESVSVSAFPALKVLFGRADRVTVRMGEVRAGQGELADLLARTAKAGKVDASAATLRVGPLVVRDAHLRKRGRRLTGVATLLEADLLAALPVAVGLKPVESGDGQLVMEASAPVLGQTVTVRARLSASEGALVIAPDGFLAGFATLTVFKDRRIAVQGVGAQPRADGFTVDAEATLAAA